MPDSRRVRAPGRYEYEKDRTVFAATGALHGKARSRGFHRVVPVVRRPGGTHADHREDALQPFWKAVGRAASCLARADGGGTVGWDRQLHAAPRRGAFWPAEPARVRTRSAHGRR